jgi:hypothetical protein
MAVTGATTMAVMAPAVPARIALTAPTATAPGAASVDRS